MRKEGLISCLERGIGWFFVVSLVGFVLLLFSCGDSKESVAQKAEKKETVYSSNGEQIYFSGTSERGTEISVEGMTGNDHMVCAGCHGPDGKGRSLRMMEEEIKSTDIRYEFLTAKEHVHGQNASAQVHDRDHPPYNDESIKRAVTQGLDPAGNTLNLLMPRWQMSDEDLNDLINFLKTLE